MSYILIHGLGQDGSSWDQTISNMTNKTHVKLELAQLCMGKDLNYQTLYQAFSNYCLKISKPLNLCGLSLGAILALNFAIDHPDRVNKLVLIAPMFKAPKNLLSFQNMVFSLMPSFSFKNIGFNKHQFIDLCDSMKNLNFVDNLNKVKCTTIVLCGKKDKINQKQIIAHVNKIPNSKFLIIPDSNHEVNIDAPEILAKILENETRS